MEFYRTDVKSNNRTSIIRNKILENSSGVNILNIDESNQGASETPYKKFDSFNIRMVYNIIGLLIDAGYFFKDAAKGLTVDD